MKTAEGLASALQSLYARLEQAGLDRKFVRKVLLPDWWDDTIAQHPTGYTEVRLRIARALGLSLNQLDSGDLLESALDETRFRCKIRRGTEPHSIRWTILLAKRAAELRDCRAFQLLRLRCAEHRRFSQGRDTLRAAIARQSLIPIAQPKFIKARMNENPLLKVPPARRGNRVGARLGSPREVGGTKYALWLGDWHHWATCLHSASHRHGLRARSGGASSYTGSGCSRFGR